MSKPLPPFPFPEKQAQALTQKLTRTTGKTIVLTNRVDPTCLGGVRLDYDGQRLDDTISHRMDSVRESAEKHRTLTRKQGLYGT